MGLPSQVGAKGPTVLELGAWLMEEGYIYEWSGQEINENMEGDNTGRVFPLVEEL